MENNREVREKIEAGWHRDIGNERYHSSCGISSTSLKNILTMPPSSFVYKQSAKNIQSPAMKLGSLVHELVLEPEMAELNYIVMPDFGDCRRTANKEAKNKFIEENIDKESVSIDIMTQAKAMADSVLNHKTASLLLDGSINESSVYWWYKGDYQDERDYKIMCKIRPDAISTSHPGMILDVKTCEDATFTSFAKQIHKFSYHLSSAMYLEGANQCKQLLDAVSGAIFFTSFIYIAVEKTPPYNVALYELSKDDLRLGRMMYRKAMQLYFDAKQESFPGYTDDIRVIELPTYSRNMHII